MILTFLTGGGVDLYLSKLLSSKLWASFVYASGDADAESFYEVGGVSVKPLSMLEAAGKA